MKLVVTGRKVRSAPRKKVNSECGRRGKRDPASTRERIMRAAIAEFCEYGFNGARIDRIVRVARSNPRMLYHYFENKSRLYIMVLARMYSELRALEASLNLGELPPLDGMRRLMDFSFDYFGKNPGLIRLMNSENLTRARFLRRVPKVGNMIVPMMAMIEDLLRRGEDDGSLRKGIDPVQLFVSITALSYFHVSNRYTLSALFSLDLAKPGWVKLRHQHATEMLVAYLRPQPSGKERTHLVGSSPFAPIEARLPVGVRPR